MKRLATLFASALSVDPAPSAPPTPLLRASTPPGSFKAGGRAAFVPAYLTPLLNEKGELVPMKLTAQHIERAIDEIENDPTAGLGLFDKRRLLVDKLLRLFNTAEASDVSASGKTAAPLLSEARKVAPPTPIRQTGTANVTIAPGGPKASMATVSARPVDAAAAAVDNA